MILFYQKLFNNLNDVSYCKSMIYHTKYVLIVTEIDYNVFHEKGPFSFTFMTNGKIYSAPSGTSITDGKTHCAIRVKSKVPLMS